MPSIRAGKSWSQPPRGPLDVSLAFWGWASKNGSGSQPGHPTKASDSVKVKNCILIWLVAGRRHRHV